MRLQIPIKRPRFDSSRRSKLGEEKTLGTAGTYRFHSESLGLQPNRLTQASHTTRRRH